MILLGHPCGRGDVLDWVRQFRALPRFPPIVVIGSGDERQIVAAHQGRRRRLRRQARAVNHARLVEAIEEALQGRRGPERQRRQRRAEPASGGQCATRFPAITRSCASWPMAKLPRSTWRSQRNAEPPAGPEGTAPGLRIRRRRRSSTASCGSTNWSPGSIIRMWCASMISAWPMTTPTSPWSTAVVAALKRRIAARAWTGTRPTG